MDALFDDADDATPFEEGIIPRLQHGRVHHDPDKCRLTGDGRG